MSYPKGIQVTTPQLMNKLKFLFFPIKSLSELSKHTPPQRYDMTLAATSRTLIINNHACIIVHYFGAPFKEFLTYLRTHSTTIDDTAT